MLNPNAWNWGAKSAFFWFGLDVACFIWTFFRLPEPKGRSYAELDVLFEEKVSARKFKNTVINPFAAASHANDSGSDEKMGTPTFTEEVKEKV